MDRGGGRGRRARGARAGGALVARPRRGGPRRGLAEPLSERESVRIALLHCLSGDLAAAEHAIAQAVQTASDELLPVRFAAWCEREGLLQAAARFR